MNYSNYIASFMIGLLSLTLMSFATPDKQIDKVVNKLWKGEEVILSDVEVPSEYNVDIQVLKKIIVNDNTEGFACYTTAFGCKIGGCAAASTPNTDAYETFDYIIIYDENLAILKVDIANYSGAYGYEICRAKWLKQFIGSTDGFELNENIDGISGATVSATYLIESLNKVGGIFKVLKQKSIL